MSTKICHHDPPDHDGTFSQRQVFDLCPQLSMSNWIGNLNRCSKDIDAEMLSRQRHREWKLEELKVFMPRLMLDSHSKQNGQYVINCIKFSLMPFSFAKFSTIAIRPALDWNVSSQLYRQKMKIGSFDIRNTPQKVSFLYNFCWSHIRWIITSDEIFIEIDLVVPYLCTTFVHDCDVLKLFQFATAHRDCEFTYP